MPHLLARKPILMLAATALAVAALWCLAQMATRSARDAGSVVGKDIGEKSPAGRSPTGRSPPAVASIAPPRAVDRRRADFETAADLFAYSRELAAAERAGDADAKWMLSRVHDYCAGYAMDPRGYAGDTRAIGDLHLPASSAMVSARERVGRRCAGFAAADGLNRDAILLRRRGAAAAGSLAAEASLLSLGAPLADTDAYKRDLYGRVLASRDPEAFVALSPAMGIAASGEEAFHDLVAGTRFNELAWQMAACRLGLDCSAGSALMTSYCANAGICSSDRQQDFSAFVLDAAVPRQGADAMEDMVVTLLNGTGTSQ